ncbi:MAG: RNA polymerase sigma factor, partial [Tannerellaceae bacterium]|nr:RNA polymerase sigma factor [Tannerellaceae bacterium]
YIIKHILHIEIIYTKILFLPIESGNILNSFYHTMNKQEIINRLAGMNDYIYFLALSRTHNAEKAKELRQNTFERILMNLDKFVEDINLEGWVSVVQKRIFLNDYDKIVRDQGIFDSENEISEITCPAESDLGNPHEELIAKELEEKLTQVDPSYRVPLELRGKGYSYNEISDQLDLNINTLKTRIRDGRKKYSHLLKDKGFTTFLMVLLSIWME